MAQKRKLYFHILEFKELGLVAYKGTKEDIDEAFNERDRLSKINPDSEFEVHPSLSEEIPSSVNN